MPIETHQQIIEESLISAIEKHSLTTIHSLISKYADVIDMAGHNMHLAMYDVLRSDSQEVARLMFDAGITLDPNHVDVAITDANVDVFKVVFPVLTPFLKERAIPSSTSIYRHPVELAIASGKLENAKHMIEQGITYTSSDISESDTTSFFSFCNRNDSRLAFVLRHVSFSKKDIAKFDPKTLATNIANLKDKDSLYALLLKQGFIDAADLPTLLKKAYQNGNADLLSFLQMNDVDITPPNFDDFTPIKYVNYPNVMRFGFAKEGQLFDRNSDFFFFINHVFKENAIETFSLFADRLTSVIKDIVNTKTDVMIDLLSDAFRSISTQEMMDAFSNTLPNDIFHGNDLIKRVISKTISINPFLPVEFYNMAISKGLTKDTSLINDMIINAFNSATLVLNKLRRSQFKKDINTSTQTAKLITALDDDTKEHAYQFTLEHSPIKGKSPKQIHAAFRSAFKSQNAQEKAAAIFLFYHTIPKALNTEYLNAFKDVDIINDYAFEIVLTAFKLSVADVMKMGVAKKLKQSIAKSFL